MSEFEMPVPGQPSIKAIVIGAQPSSTDPMAQRSFVGVKIGALVEIKDGEDPRLRVQKELAGIELRILRAAFEALTVEGM